MKPSDLSLLRIPSAPSLSPDGGLAAVAVSRIDLEADEYRSQVWLVPTDHSSRPRPFTQGDRDSEPVWSPDGRWLAFVRAGKDAPGQLHVMPADGGEPRAVCEHPLGVSGLAWSPDSTRIAYVARVPEEGRYERGPEAKAPAKEPARRITSLRYRLDNLGFYGDRPAHVFVVDPFGGAAGAGAGHEGPVRAEPLRLTHTDVEFGSPAWSPDGRWVVATAQRTDDELSLADDLYVLPAAGGDARRVTRGTTTGGDAAFSPDGETIYFLGTDQLDVAGRTVGLFAVPFDGSEPPKRLTDAERWDLNDAHSTAKLTVTKEGLLAVAAWRGSLELVRIGYDGGEPEVLSTGRRQVYGFAVAGGTTAVSVSTDVSAGEVGVLRDGAVDVLTDFGAELSRGSSLRPMEELTATSADGYEPHGWVVKPTGTGPFPVVLAIHGGPFTQYGYSLFDEAQVYAGAGYAVVLANPRGSSGYGEAHGRAIVGDMGRLDRQDLMALLEAALTDPELDGSRVGVMGGSYGGYMTTWLSAQEGSRFRAAISERAVNAWDSFTGSSDIGWFFTRLYTGEDADRTLAQSPFTYVDRIDLPFLIIHSENDWRCPVEQAQRLFVALKVRGVDTELLLFPGEGHELSRSGLPSHRIQRFEAILGWWGRHLQPAE